MDPSPSTRTDSGRPTLRARLRAACPTGLRFRGVPVVTLLLLGFAVSVLLGNYLPTRASVAATDRALTQQQAENRAMAERIRCADAEAERLTRDPWANERILRDDLRMSEKGEVIIR